MKEKQNKIGKALTLLELLVSICLLSLVVLMLSSINVFFWNNYNGIQRKAGVQNDVLYIISHIRKTSLRVVGDNGNPPIYAVGANKLGLFIDKDADGVWSSGDVRYSYVLTGNKLDFGTASSGPLPNEVVSEKIIVFNSQAGTGKKLNTMTVNFSVCSNPKVPATCGKMENPQMNVTMNITMPMVSHEE